MWCCYFHWSYFFVSASPGELCWDRSDWNSITRPLEHLPSNQVWLWGLFRRGACWYPLYHQERVFCPPSNIPVPENSPLHSSSSKWEDLRRTNTRCHLLLRSTSSWWVLALALLCIHPCINSSGLKGMWAYIIGPYTYYIFSSSALFEIVWCIIWFTKKGIYKMFFSMS